MKKFNYKPNLLGRSISAILAGSTAFMLSAPAFAAEAEQNAAVVAEVENQKSEEVEEEIQVSGIRYSQLSALNRKKMAGTMMDSLVAEDIGQFPDKNIAEALQRIPGVQLARDFGEGAQVSLRGVEPSLLKVEMNGVSALGFNGDRGVDFRDMASELIKSLDVIKGSEARLTEGGVGGTIHIETRKPSEFTDNFLSVSAEGQYNDMIDDISPKYNLTGVYKITDNFGAMVNITGSDKSTMIHAIRNTEWNRFADYDEPGAEKTTIDEDYADITVYDDCLTQADDPSACQKQWWDYSPVTPRYGIWGRQEERLSAKLTLDYKFNDHFTSYVSYTHNTRQKEALDYNIDLGVGSVNNVNASTVVVDDLHNVKYFETRKAGVSNRTLKFAWDQTTTLADAGFIFNYEAWRVEGIISKSTSEQDIDSRDTHATADNISGIKVTLNEDGMPEWDYSDGYFDYSNPSDSTVDVNDKFDVNDPASYRNRVRYKYAPHWDESSEIMAKLDVTYIPESGIFNMFRAGYRSASLKVENADFQHNLIRDVGQKYNGIEWTRQDNIDVLTGRMDWTPSLFRGYDLPVSTVGRYMAVQTEPFIEAMQQVFQENVVREDLQVRGGYYDQVINTDAFYVQADFETELADMRVWGNFGVRHVQTEVGANGDVTEVIMVNPTDRGGNTLYAEDMNTPSPGVDNPYHEEAYTGRKTVVESYGDTLPSLNVHVGLVPDELVLYVGLAKVMSHPKAGDLNVNASCTTHYNERAVHDNINNTCSAGNPALDPYMANQWEVALNWYPNETSIVAASYFVKDITSWIIDAQSRYDVDFFGDGRLWEVRQKINGTGVKNTGIEIQASTMFDFLPAPFDKTGGNINYTYLTSDNVGLYNQLTGAELPFPSMSENSYNLGFFYEDENWSARIAYNYRDEYLAKTADRSGNPVFVDAAGYMDAKLIYTFANGLKVFVDGRNLTAEVKSENAGPGRLSDMQWSGREYTAGFSYKF